MSPVNPENSNHPYADQNGDDPLAPSNAEDAAAAVADIMDAAGDDGDEGARIQKVITALQDEVAAAKDQTLRALADAENTRRRAVKEREDATKFAISSFARDLLDFSDNFRRALSAIPEDARAHAQVSAVIQGIEAMEKDLFATFEKHGIKKITPMDEPFDPNFHEAMFEAPGTGKPAGTVIQVVESGYVIKDRLLRPARVGIAKGDGAAPSGGHIDTSA